MIGLSQEEAKILQKLISYKEIELTFINNKCTKCKIVISSAAWVESKLNTMNKRDCIYVILPNDSYYFFGMGVE